jgi:DNA mismatch repair protein MutS2
VSVDSLGQEGEVLAIEDGFAEIQLGSLKLRQPLDALTRLGRVKAQQERQVFRPAAPEFVPMEIDIRGHRAAEVPELLEGYLESGYRAGLPWVRIIHGKGTGALREVVRNHLRGHPVVASSQLAPAEQGGDGATVVQLKQE